MGGDEVIMPRKKANVLVTSKECRGNHERMIRRFIKKTKKAKIVHKIKEKRYYVKPSDQKRADKKRSDRRRIREELKKQRAEEKRNRKKR